MKKKTTTIEPTYTVVSTMQPKPRVKKVKAGVSLDDALKIVKMSVDEMKIKFPGIQVSQVGHITRIEFDEFSLQLEITQDVPDPVVTERLQLIQDALNEKEG